MLPNAMALETIVNPLVNRDAALDRVGGDEELLTEITRLFLEDYPRLIADIRAAVDARDATALEHAAHSLKGSVANFGAEPAWQVAFELEKMGRSANLAGAPAAFEKLELIFRQLQPELEDLAR